MLQLGERILQPLNLLQTVFRGADFGQWMRIYGWTIIMLLIIGMMMMIMLMSSLFRTLMAVKSSETRDASYKWLPVKKNQCVRLIKGILRDLLEERRTERTDNEYVGRRWWRREIMREKSPAEQTVFPESHLLVPMEGWQCHCSKLIQVGEREILPFEARKIVIGSILWRFHDH